MQMAKGDSSPAINIKANQFKKGSSSAAVTVLKKKLIRSGDLPAGDTSSMYNDSLAMAVQRYQTKNGMVATGKITDTLIRDMNVPAKQRLQQLIINLYRAQWMPVNRETNYVAVNIPDFLLTVYENNQPVFDIPVAVGKEGTGTTIFTGDMNQVVFSPYWNIPASIVRNEILPKMKANPKYLESRNMERMGGPDSLPVIRQKPGKENALGRVKFLFPNRYDIYLHDTNNKEIFNKSVRAVSHGCIRLQEPEKLANYILRNDKSWTPEKIHAAMEGSKEQYVEVSPAVPVWITYYTAWVDDNGLMHYRDDIYKHDAEAGRMLFL